MWYGQTTRLVRVKVLALAVAVWPSFLLLHLGRYEAFKFSERGHLPGLPSEVAPGSCGPEGVPPNHFVAILANIIYDRYQNVRDARVCNAETHGLAVNMCSV